jgi:uncharacterized membrane protein
MTNRALLTALAASVCAAAIGAGPAHWTLVTMAFRAVCHQIPQRCLWIAGTPMPVCARCAGIYFGALAALITRAQWRRNGLLAAGAMVALDVASEAIGLRPAIAVLRVATGFGLGWFAAPSLWSAATGRRFVADRFAERGV